MWFHVLQLCLSFSLTLHWWAVFIFVQFCDLSLFTSTKWATTSYFLWGQCLFHWDKHQQTKPSGALFLWNQCRFCWEHTNKQNDYHIKIKGHLDTRWQDWFDGLTITLTNDGDTILSGVIVDQAALHGVFKKVSNLGLTIISVNPQTKGE